MTVEEHLYEQLPGEVADIQDKMAALYTLAMKCRDTETTLAERTHLLSLCATVGTTLAGDDSLRASLQRCAEALVEHLDVAAACIWTLSAEGEHLEMQANAGRYLPMGDLEGTIPVGTSVIGAIAQEKQPYVSNAVADNQRLRNEGWAQWTGLTAFAAYPLVVEDRLKGIMAMFATHPFTPDTCKALAWMATVIAMGIDRICIADALARSMAKVIRMNRSLQHKNAEFDEFTYIASHDLQEPLRKLTSFTDMLRRDLGEALSGRAARDLTFIVDASNRMQMLLHNLLDLSRTGNAVMHSESIALDRCVDRALKALGARIQAIGATIKRDALPTVLGDHRLLTQLYQHLFSNALKFCSDQRPVIHITAIHQSEGLIFGVQDNGIGIESTYHEHIFAPFKRLHGRDAYEGTGIGLAICRKAIERHGGSIWVESEAGQGAHFRFTLAEPAGPAQPEPL